MQSPLTDRLQHWLHRLERMQPDKIDLGLGRIKQVAVALGVDEPDFRIITVAGTNGKGSTVAYADAILTNLGYSTGVYTSPHFIDFNERIVVNSKRVTDQLLCDAFDEIDQVRGDISLTYFEFTTLAAIVSFGRANIDVAVLEVGLGGRLDAVNAWDCDVACISSIAIDHIDWLGDDRELIGREKAGIARKDRPLICGDVDPPASIAEASADAGATLFQRGIDFHVERMGSDQWQYRDALQTATLPLPAIEGDWACDNAAVSICAVGQLLGSAPSLQSVEQSLQQVTMTGRMQTLELKNTRVILDVAHNRAAAEKLHDYLSEHPVAGITRAVFGCMQDKDITAIVDEMAPVIDHWCIANIDYPRAMDGAEIEREVAKHGAAEAEIFASVIQATTAAIAQSGVADRVVVFGSFHVVGPALEVVSSSL